MAYLFCYFTGESQCGEQIYFSVSKDGLHWEDLYGDKPVIISKVGEKGLRDPFLVRKQDGSGFVIIATDLRIASQKGWEDAVTNGSKSIAVTESSDLIHWTDPVLVRVGAENAGCVWAPEVIFDEKEKNYLVFWASKIAVSGEAVPKQRIYAARTTDFYHYSEPEIYLERENHVIDMTMAYEEGMYYRFSKDETKKTIRVDRGASLDKDCFTEITVPILNEMYGVEGPEIYYLEEEKKWCLIVDRFAVNGGYLPILCDKLSTCDFKVLDESKYDMGTHKKRHGGVLAITEEEYLLLKRQYQ